MTYSSEDVVQIERLIRISKDLPLSVETFVPWDADERPGDVLLPEKLISLYGLPVYSTLSDDQKRELARREVVQAMYGYCWSESLFCLFMTRYILHKLPDDLERRFLLREVMEECKHQDMFAAAIRKLGVAPVPATRFQRLVGSLTVKYFPPDLAFISCLAVELMADRYGEHLDKSPGVYPVLQRVAQLHNIEEARHIVFTKSLLKRYTERAGFWRRSLYSVVVLLNMRFFQTTYVRSEIYAAIQLPRPKRLRRQAMKLYREHFADECLSTVTEFVHSFRGFNLLTRPLWRWMLNVRI